MIEREHPSTVWQTRDVRGHLLAGIVLSVRGAQAQGGHVQFIAGILALAEHQAHAVQIDWPMLLDDARTALGAPVARLVDQAVNYARLPDGTEVNL